MAKRAFTFPGQGSQAVGMGKDLAEAFPEARAVFDEVAAMVLTLPVVLPIVTQLGYDPIWWGIVNVVVIEIGMICPPMGINVFLLHAMAKEVPLAAIYRGIVPFLAADVVRLAAIALFPPLSLWLVQLSRGA